MCSRARQFTFAASLLFASHGVYAAAPDALSSLGKALFFDVNLSWQRTQACATCHAPGNAFVDTRQNLTGGAVSLGDDGASLGTRNAPTLSYAALTPAFHIDQDGAYRGGLFHDGRAHDLTEQAGEPILNPIEMALPDATMLMARIMENTAYVAALSQLYGAAVLQDPEGLHSAVAGALAAFQRTPEFAPFDSKYDRYLRGEYTMTQAEERGRLLFFSSLINCNSCHMLNAGERETFTDYSYHNIGVPGHPLVQQHGTGALPDQGLLHNPRVDDREQAGKFKVPTLRNIAVTAPYMHNGVFRELRTVLEFYNQYIITNTYNPESGAPWRPPEIEANISHSLLSQGQPMDRYRIETLLAFLKTLTDRQYEHLLAD